MFENQATTQPTLAEAYLVCQVALGHVAKFQERFGGVLGTDENRTIKAHFIQDIMIKQPFPRSFHLAVAELEAEYKPFVPKDDFAPVYLTIKGLQATGAIISGVLNLSDASGGNAEGLPALALEHCLFADHPPEDSSSPIPSVDVSYSRLARLSLKGSKFSFLSARECQIDGNLCLAGISPVNASSDQPTEIHDLTTRAINVLEASQFVIVLREIEANIQNLEPRDNNFPFKKEALSILDDVESKINKSEVEIDSLYKQLGFSETTEARWYHAIGREDVSVEGLKKRIDNAMAAILELKRLIKTPFLRTRNGPAHATTSNWPNELIEEKINTEEDDVSAYLRSPFLTSWPESRMDHCWADFTGSRIDGGLDLNSAKLRIPKPRESVVPGQRRWAMKLRDCEINGSIFATRGAEFFGGILIDNSTIEGDIWLGGAKTVMGEINLSFSATQSRIAGALSFQDLAEKNEEPAPFQSYGSCYLYGIRAGYLSFDGGRFDGVGSSSIDASQIDVKNDLTINNIIALGSIGFNGSNIGGAAWVNGTIIIAFDGHALNLYRLTLGSDLMVSGSKLTKEEISEDEIRLSLFDGGVSLRSVDIKGDISIKNSILFSSKDTWAIDAIDGSFSGGLEIDSCLLLGGATLWAAHVGYRLGIWETTILASKNSEEDGWALVLDNAIVGETVSFSHSTSKSISRFTGGLSLCGIKVSGDLNFQRSVVQSRSFPMLLQGANISGTFDITKCELHLDSLQLDGLICTDFKDIVGRNYEKYYKKWPWLKCISSKKRHIVENLIDAVFNPPLLTTYDYITKTKNGELRVEFGNMRYYQLSPGWDYKNRLNIMANFRSDARPYMQLAQVADNGGAFEMGRAVRQEWYRRSISEKARLNRFWWIFPKNPFEALVNFVIKIFGLCFGHGLSPKRAAATLITCFVVGWGFISWLEWRHALVVDQQPIAGMVRQSQMGAQVVSQGDINSSVPCVDQIRPSLYALDVFIPLVDLRQESKCEVGEAQDFVPAAFDQPKGLFISFSNLPGAFKAALPLPKEVVGAKIWLPHEIDFYRYIKVGYALLGWLMTSMALLTFSGVIKNREQW